VAPRSAQDDPEYRRNYPAFEYVHALYALDHGWTGQGVLVGVADDGVVQNAELAGQLSSLSRDFGNVTTSGGTQARNAIGDSFSDHGTLVAGIVAGKNDGTGIQGIAPDARIVALRVSDTNTVTDKETLGRTLPAALDYAAANGVKVVNISLAKSDASEPSPTWSNMVTRYAAAGGLIVNAAGNDAEANPKGYLDLNASNQAGWIFVVALDENGSGVTLADYSNKCGAAAMDRCVAAMGTQATMDRSGQLVLFSGTSAAAPQVSGLAALILSKWPQLTGVQAGQVILNTARDLGAPGVDTVYGHGLVDAEAALSPASPTLSNGVTQTALAGSAMVVPDVLGGTATATAVRAALSKVTVLDAYGRDYSGDISGMVARPSAARGMLERQMLANAGAGTSRFESPGFGGALGYVSAPRLAGAPAGYSRLTWGHFAMAAGNTTVEAGYADGDAVQDQAMGLAPTSDVARAYAPAYDLSLGLRRPLGGGAEMSVGVLGGGDRGRAAQGVVVGLSRGAVQLKTGWVAEKNAVFGTPVGSGALRFGDGTRSVFAEVSARSHVGGWQLAGYASLGATRLRLPGDTLLTSAGTILTQRMGASVAHAMAGGWVTLGAALPLGAVSGRGTLTYADAYDLAARTLVYARRSVDFSGRVDPVLSVGFERAGIRSSLRAALMTQVASGDVRALGTWRTPLP